MDNKPKALTSKDIMEIAAIEDIQQMWGAENAAEMEEILDTTVYAVKFDYHSGSPGYVGDYFILQGDAIGEPIELIRNNKERTLAIVNASTL
jgi:hypothetical protein